MTGNKRKRASRSMKKAALAYQATSQSPSTQSADHRQEPTQILRTLEASQQTKDARKPRATRQARVGLEFRVVEASKSQASARIRWECLEG